MLSTTYRALVHDTRDLARSSNASAALRPPFLFPLFLVSMEPEKRSRPSWTLCVAPSSSLTSSTALNVALSRWAVDAGPTVSEQGQRFGKNSSQPGHRSGLNDF